MVAEPRTAEADPLEWRAPIIAGLCRVVCLAVGLVEAVLVLQYGPSFSLPLVWLAGAPIGIVTSAAAAWLPRLTPQARLHLCLAGMLAGIAICMVAVGYAPGLALGLLSVVIFAATLGSPRLLVTCAAVSVALFVVAAVLVAQGLAPLRITRPVTQPLSWVRVGVVYLVLLAPLLVLVGAVVRRLEEARRAQQRVIQAIANEHRQRARADELRRESERALLASRRMRLIGRLAEGIVHEQNNHLLVMMSWIDLLREGRCGPGDATYHAGVTSMARAANDSARLMRSLMSFHGAGAARTETCMLDATIAMLLALLKRLVPEDVRIRFEPGARAPDLSVELRAAVGDAIVGQLLLHLLLDARGATDAGRVVEIRTWPDGAGAVCIEVRGVGGAEPDDASFDIVRRLARQHQCAATYTDGAVLLRLPLAASLQGDEPAEPGSLAGWTILVVERDAETRGVLERTLALAGAEVLCVARAQAGVELLRRYRRRIDVLCTGEGPVADDGRRLIDAFRSQFGDGGVLLLERALTAASSEEIRRLGCVALPKLFSGRDLLVAIQALRSSGARAEAVG